MILERIKSEGIAHNSYFLGLQNEAVIIDPRRDIQVYIDVAQKNGMKIKHIFETHRNEDYVIGSIELNQATGAEIYHGPRSDWGYGNVVNDGQTFKLGHLEIKAIHTPGHTDESMSYVVTDLSSGGAPIMVFTGDVLFVGDVGRTDLYGREQAKRMASNLYDSIFNKLLPLGDQVMLYPAHGSGSVCGMRIADRDDSTLGIERLQNPILQFKNKEDFIKYKMSEEPERPPYFRQMEKYNLQGPPLLDCVHSPTPLTPSQFKTEIEKGAVVIDTNQPNAFAGAHIKGAYSIWLEGLPVFAGWILDYNKPVLLVLDEDSSLDKAVRYLTRVGYDSIAGYLKGGTQEWNESGLPIESRALLSVHQLKEKLNREEELVVLDTRDNEEWASRRIENTLHIYVGHLEQRLGEVPRDRPVAVICSVGHRASLGASILLRAGYIRVFNVLGGLRAWLRAGFPVVKG